jgi:hypothetical protein
LTGNALGPTHLLRESTASFDLVYFILPGHASLLRNRSENLNPATPEISRSVTLGRSSQRPPNRCRAPVM